MDNEPFITVGNGGRWYFGNPDANVLSLHETVNSLAQCARFGGHARLVKSQLYSVAQHSVKVAQLVYVQTGNDAQAYDGLMHDAHEAVIGDWPTPMKVYFRAQGVDVDTLERQTAQRFAELFNTTYPLPDVVKWADAVMCLIEAWHLLPNRGKDIWLGPEHEAIETEARELLDSGEYEFLRPNGWSIIQSRAIFLDTFRRYGGTQL